MRILGVIQKLTLLYRFCGTCHCCSQCSLHLPARHGRNRRRRFVPVSVLCLHRMASVCDTLARPGFRQQQSRIHHPGDYVLSPCSTFLVPTGTGLDPAVHNHPPHHDSVRIYLHLCSQKVPNFSHLCRKGGSRHGFY